MSDEHAGIFTRTGRFDHGSRRGPGGAASATSHNGTGYAEDMRPDLKRNQRPELATDWATLQRPGFSPDDMEGRWSEGLYLDQPHAWDDPYRFFRW